MAVGWDELEAFAAVADELSFSRAARRLHLSSPAVSQRIQRLERRLGTRLFERTTRRVVLTPAGEALRGEVADLELMLRRIQDRVQGEAGAAVGDGADAPFGLLGVPAGPVLDRLREALPEVAWRPVRLPSLGEAAAAVRTELTAALLYAYPRTPWSGFRGLAVATVVREPLEVYLPPGHRAGARPVLPLPDLAGERWVVPAEPGARRALGRLGREAGFQPRFQHVAATPAEALELVGGGAGIALGSPVWPLPDGVSRVRLDGPVVATLRLVWDPARTGPEWAPALLGPLRALYAEVAERENPRWWAELRSNPPELAEEG